MNQIQEKGEIQTTVPEAKAVRPKAPGTGRDLIRGLGTITQRPEALLNAATRRMNGPLGPLVYALVVSVAVGLSVQVLLFFVSLAPKLIYSNPRQLAQMQATSRVLEANIARLENVSDQFLGGPSDNSAGMPAMPGVLAEDKALAETDNEMDALQQRDAILQKAIRRITGNGRVYAVCQTAVFALAMILAGYACRGIFARHASNGKTEATSRYLYLSAAQTFFPTICLVLMLALLTLVDPGDHARTRALWIGVVLSILWYYGALFVVGKKLSLFLGIANAKKQWPVYLAILSANALIFMVAQEVFLRIFRQFG
jgi:hypothetical protein